MGISIHGISQHYFKKDLSTDWVVQDKITGEYRPIIDNADEHDIIHFYLNLRKNKSNEMEVCNRGAISLLIEGSITNSTFDQGCSKYRLDSLYNIYKKDSVLVTFYKEESSASVTSSLLYPALGYIQPTGLNVERQLIQGGDFYIVSLLIILALVVLLKEKFRKFYEDFLSPSKLLRLRTRENNVYKSKFLSPEVITVIFIESLALSLLLISIITSVQSTRLSWLNESGSFVVMFGNWITMALILLLLQIGYFFILGLTNIFFNRKQFDVIPFFENLRLNYYALIILFSLSVAAFAISSNALHTLLSSIWVLLILLYGLRTIIIFLRLASVNSIRKLHLFSYFCATEMIPTMVIVKVVFF